MSLHNEVMNIQCIPDSRRDGMRDVSSAYIQSYKLGHRDARHAAAEMSMKYERALEEAKEALQDLAEFGRITSDDCSEFAKETLAEIKNILKEC